MSDAFTFAAEILRQDSGMGFHYLPVPADAAEAMLAAGSRRVIATINDHTVRRGLLGTPGESAHVIVSRDIMRQAGAGVGEVVFVELRPDPTPDEIDLAEEFEAALAQDDEAAERFYGMTTGQRRSLASYVSSAKRPETRIKRALELAHKLRTYTLYGDKRPEP